MVFAIYFTASWVSLVAQMVKSLPTMQETWIWSLGQGDPLEKEMAAHSSILAWRSPTDRGACGLQSMGSQRVGHDWATKHSTWLWWLGSKESTCQCRRLGLDPWVREIPWRRKWLPTPVFLPGKSHGERNLVGYSPWQSVGHYLAAKRQ